MLNAKDFRELEHEISRIYSRVETDLVRKVCRYLSSLDGAEVDMGDWRVRKLAQMPLLEADVRQILKADTKAMESELEEAVRIVINKNEASDTRIIDALMKHVEDKSNVTVQIATASLQEQRIRAVLANARQAVNLTNTFAEQASQRAFVDAVNRAYISVVEGIDTVDNAVWKASKALARQGMTVATYSSGSQYSISMDSAIRRNVVTSVAQATAEASISTARQYGLDLVKTTEHLGARPEHFLWQGKVFSLSGESTKYPWLSASQEEGGTGYGTAGGLCGCNCRHHFFPWVEGFEPADYGIDVSSRENEELYDASQKQRAYERQIRGWKRTEAVARDEGRLAEAQEARKRVNIYREKVKDLCEAYDLPREYAREKA